MPVNRNIVNIRPNIIRTSLRKSSPPINMNNSELAKSYGSVDKIWNNETVYLIGGGPSLLGFNWSLLSNKKTIAINKAYNVLPEAAVLYWTDVRFYNWFKADIDNFKGLKVTCKLISTEYKDITILRTSSVEGLDMRPEYICHGNNSGYGAINLAAKMGAKKIYLLGFDMAATQTNTHWHSGYSVKHNTSIYPKMMNHFNCLPELLKQQGIEIWNANPNSMLTMFNKCTIESAINDNPIL